VERTGIGPALRKARLLRGKSLEEASRETRIRAEYLQALERERFESLIGHVYARGFLRSYSTYLGLDADKVVTIYNRHFGGPRPTLPEPSPGPMRGPRSPRPHLPTAMRNHPSWTFLTVVAVGALAVFAAAGLFRSAPAASPRTADGAPPSSAALGATVTVDIQANEPLTAIISVDGDADEYLLDEGEGLSFEGDRQIDLQLDRGGVAILTVNGYEIGTPGEPKSPYRAVFFPHDYMASPSVASTP
jgi:cytoskeleton protein RodZ